jgi:hypothetical protein
LKKLTFILLALPILVVVLLLSQLRWKFSRPSNVNPPTPDIIATNVTVTAISPFAAVPTSEKSALLGDTILREYANTNLPPENDLTLVSRLMENSLLLLMPAGNRPLSANEDWADLLRGQNAAHEQFLSDQNDALNTNGQLVDRWGTPLFFHALGGGRFELRSAGPDRKLWTEDDIHRNADGSFRRGKDLNPESLLPEATGRQSP